MNSLQRQGKPDIPLDPDGYLKNLADWDEEVAGLLAAEADLKLDEAHWEVIRVLREFYQEHQLAPANRALVRLVGRELGPDKGRSIYLMKLFGGKPALLSAKIAGLPRPRNCF